MSEVNTDDYVVIKRNGSRETVCFDKITQRLKTLCGPLCGAEIDTHHVNITELVISVIGGMTNQISTEELDVFSAQIAASKTTHHPDYARLAGRIMVSNLQKQTAGSFSDTIEQLYAYRDPVTNASSPRINERLYAVVREHKERLNAAIDYERDFLFEYFGYMTLAKSYLMKLDGKIVERPQHMYMRVALGIHYEDIEAVLDTYHAMSQHYFIHATPTLYNAGTTFPQLSSCFLLTMKDDSIQGIFETLTQTAIISKYGGGIGLSVHNIRAEGSFISGTNGVSNGLVPMLRVFNNAARYVDQGGGKRKGSFAVYLEPWHADIVSFLALKKPMGDETLRARDLFYALWINDLFMERVKTCGKWSLFCPNQAPGLSDCWGEEFRAKYEDYERRGLARKTMPAHDLWVLITNSQMETGGPFLVYKDACNRKSNQQNLGTIHSSNLCTEIVQYSSADECAVCNLASMNLRRFVRADGSFDYALLGNMTRTVTRNLNRVIDYSYYPLPEAAVSNRRHRPMGIGVQGLADALIAMRLPYTSAEALEVNRRIAETMYFHALDMSCDLAQQDGPYETYFGSPMSNGQLQCDLWGVTPTTRWDWEGLRARIAKHGVRNSLLLAIMPTASTSIILGNTESTEPISSVMENRRVLAGEFLVVSKQLVYDLVKRGLWTEKVRQQIIAAFGSVKHVDSIPQDLKDLYCTAWEMTQRTIIDMASARAPYICQSQSLNLYMAEPTTAKLSSMHMYAWESGLKTGCYYLRSQSKMRANPTTVSHEMQKQAEKQAQKQQPAETGNKECTDEVCVMCSA